MLNYKLKNIKGKQVSQRHPLPPGHPPLPPQHHILAFVTIAYLIHIPPCLASSEASASSAVPSYGGMSTLPSTTPPAHHHSHTCPAPSSSPSMPFTFGWCPCSDAITSSSSVLDTMKELPIPQSTLGLLRGSGGYSKGPEKTATGSGWGTDLW